MVEPTLDPAVWLDKHLAEADTDLLREMLQTFIQALMSAEADAACGALPDGERSPDRVNSRNGYRPRTFETRTGTMELVVPKLRTGSYFPEWLLEPRRRAERSLVAVIAECYVKGVSTRKVEGLVRTLGIEVSYEQKLWIGDLVKDVRTFPLEQERVPAWVAPAGRVRRCSG